MKKIGLFSTLCLLGLVLLLGLSNVISAYAQQAEKPKPLEIDDTTWGIQLTYTAKEGKEQISTDLLIFKDKKFNSESFEKKDYEATNYTLSIKDDKVTVFETMQTKGNDKAFWRGEIRDKGIRGILSVHLKKGEVKDYTFVGGIASGFIGDERKAQEEAEKRAKAAEEAAARQAEAIANAAATNTTEQGIGDKLKGILDKITGKTPEAEIVPPAEQESQEQ